MKNAFSNYSIIVMTFALVFTTNCKKEAKLPVVSTTAVTNITATTATSGGTITSDGGATITANGVCWSTSANPSTTDSKTIDGNTTGQFVSSISGLTTGTTYHVRAYATNSVGTAYGADMSFSTSGQAPSCLTQSATNITATAATLNGTVNPNYLSTMVTFEYGTTTTYGSTATSAQSPVTGNSITNVSADISSLTSNTTYHFRAKAVNSVGTTYGSDMTFTTLAGAPTLTTTVISGVTTTTASSGGNITSDGGSAVTSRGVCWGTSSGATVSSSHTSDGTGSGTFTSSLTGLTANTTYYVRAYATNSVGTAYGNEVTFKTNQIVIPTLTTTAATSITSSSAISGGNITSDGGGSVTARGVCWSTTSNPTISNNKTSDGNGSGTFTSNISGLAPVTTYHIRAYATNSAGTGYGNDLTFTTLPGAPTLTTIPISIITTTTASSGGNIISNGGSAITSNGVCWSTLSGPTISGSHTSDVTGGGTFTSSLTGLTSGTTYYVRSYATNSEGTAYGNEITFTTQTTGTVSDIEGNVYKTITIGAQTWFAENLKVTKFNDGTSIPNVTDGSIWYATTTPAYCWYNDDIINKNIYGALYIWYTVNPSSNGGKNVCPVGWHVPTDAEWDTLELYLTNNGFGYGGSGDEIAKALAETSGWNNSDTEGAVGNDQSTNNLSGFSALPGGGRMANNNNNIFSTDVGVDGNWWCAPVNNEGTNWARQISWFTGIVIRGYQYKYFGLSIRCTKD